MRVTFIDVLISGVLIIVLSLALLIWLIVAAPIQYFVYLICAAPDRVSLPQSSRRWGDLKVPGWKLCKPPFPYLLLTTSWTSMSTTSPPRQRICLVRCFS